MGLDMYLFEKRKGTRSDDADNQDDIELGYWRKFSALHNYITQLVGKGPDLNVTPVDLDIFQVNEILNTLINVQTILKEGTKIYDEDGNIADDDNLYYVYDEETSDRVYEIFEPVSGFFFGSMEIDDLFEYKVNKAIDVFRDTYIAMLNDPDMEVYYYCWW